MVSGGGAGLAQRARLFFAGGRAALSLIALVRGGIAPSSPSHRWHRRTSLLWRRAGPLPARAGSVVRARVTRARRALVHGDEEKKNSLPPRPSPFAPARVPRPWPRPHALVNAPFCTERESSPAGVGWALPPPVSVKNAALARVRFSFVSSAHPALISLVLLFARPAPPSARASVSTGERATGGTHSPCLHPSPHSPGLGVARDREEASLRTLSVPPPSGHRATRALQPHQPHAPCAP